MQDVEFSFSEGYARLRELCQCFGISVGEERHFRPDQRILLLAIRCNGEMIGMASGVYSAPASALAHPCALADARTAHPAPASALAHPCALPDDDSFRIFNVRIEDREKRRQLAVSSLCALLEEARRRFAPRRYEWMYDLAPGARDSYANFMKRLNLPWLKQAAREVVGRRVRVFSSALRDRSMPHNRHSFSRESLERNGFVILPLDALDPGTEEKIKALLAAPEEDNRGLSPLEEKDSYDRDTSFVVAEKATGDVAGWMVCRPHGKDLELCCWYCANRFRAKNISMVVSGFLLRTVQEAWDSLTFTTMARYSSYPALRKFFSAYFKDGAANQADVCRIVFADAKTARPAPASALAHPGSPPDSRASRPCASADIEDVEDTREGAGRA